jgi:hypothetical protein
VRFRWRPEGCNGHPPTGLIVVVIIVALICPLWGITAVEIERFLDYIDWIFKKQRHLPIVASTGCDCACSAGDFTQ